jgi:hypothetical protein
MHTVVETEGFLRSAHAAGMSGSETAAVVSYVASHPDAGDEIVGTGGCRKIRVAGRGKGKSGGYRVITFFSGPSIPVFLLYAYSKGDRGDLDGKQRNDLRRLAQILVDTHRARRIVRKELQ